MQLVSQPFPPPFLTLRRLGIVCQDLSFSGKRTLLIITWSSPVEKRIWERNPQRDESLGKKMLRSDTSAILPGNLWLHMGWFYAAYIYDWCMLLMNLTFLYMGLCKNVRIINRQVQTR